MQLTVKTTSGVEAVLDVDADLPLAVAQAQAASVLELEQEPFFVFQGRLLTNGDKSLRELGLEDASFVVAAVKTGTARPVQSAAAKATLAAAAAAARAAPYVATAAAGGASASTPAASAAAALQGSHSSSRALDSDLVARTLQSEEDERTARRVQAEVDGDIARQEQAKLALGEERAAELAAVPRLVHVRGDIAACGTWIPLMVDTGAQMSVLSSGLAERLQLLPRLDRSAAGVAGGVGQARILGKLRGIGVRFGELELAIDFAVLDGSQLPSPNLAILGLDQLAVHHMAIDLDTRTVRVGGIDGYQVSMLQDFEVPEEFRMHAAQRCAIQ